MAPLKDAILFVEVRLAVLVHPKHLGYFLNGIVEFLVLIQIQCHTLISF